MAKIKKDEGVVSDSKNKAVKAAVDMIKERFGDGSIMRMGDSTTMDIDAITSGCLSLDINMSVHI